MANNPCVKDCQNRSATCHAECERYAAFAKEREAELMSQNKQRAVDSRLDGQIIERIARIKKRRSKVVWKSK